MEVTVSNLENVQLGHIVAQDIFANTKSPIIAQNTVIRPVHLLILEAFQVKMYSLRNLNRQMRRVKK